MANFQNSDGHDRIEFLKRRLYSRAKPLNTEGERSEIKRDQHEVRGDWADGAGGIPVVEQREKKKFFSFSSKIFIGSLIFFIISLGVAAVIFFGGLNIVSSKNVDIAVLGPVSTAGGEELLLEIAIKNGNSVDLENAVLTVAFPEGTRRPGSDARPLIMEKYEIGGIKAGETARRTVRAVLYGEKDTVQQIKVSTNYKIRTSNAEFQKEKIYEIAIKSSPLIMTIDYPAEVNVNQDLEFIIELSSNTNQPLNDLVVRAEFPFGFVFKSSEPGAYFENNVWRIGDLEALGKRTVAIRGFIEAQDNEERTFRFYVGKGSEDDERQIGVNLAVATRSVTIKKPQLALDIGVGGTVGREYVAYAGVGGSAMIGWKNNLPVNIENARIEAKVTGDMLDKASVRPGGGGYYRSSDDTIIWDKFVYESLAQIGPGDGSVVSFSFVPFRVTPQLIAAVRDPEIIIEATMEGNRIEGGLPQKIVGTASKRVKVGTEIGLSGRVIHSTGPFENHGPIPPKADVETTYTIAWSVTNTFNNVSGGRVTASLPPYVVWKELSSPSAERISFNPLTREVVWDFGELKRGVGYTSSPREVYFQVGVTPSLSHVGTSPTILNDMHLTARDNFTGREIRADESGLTVEAGTDPDYKQGDSSVTD